MIGDGGWIRNSLARLVEIPSLSGQEHDAQLEVERLMLEAGARVRRVPIDTARLRQEYGFESPTAHGGMFAVVGRWGEDETPLTILNGHVDTVAPVPGWAEDAHHARIEGGRMFGLGTADMKAGLVSAVAAAARAAASGALSGCVEVQSVPDEEAGGGTGSLACVDELRSQSRRPRLVIVCEPTRLEVATAQVGSRSVRFTVGGLEAHSNSKHLGASAVEAAMDLARRLGEIPERFGIARHPLLPAASVNVGLIVGGVGATTVANLCTMEICFTYPPSVADLIVGYTEGVIAEWRAAQSPEISMSWVEMHNVRPFESDASSEAISRFLSVAGTSPGAESRAVGFPAGSDGRLFAALTGSETIIFGPGDISDIHKAGESVLLAEASEHSRVLEAFLRL